MKSKSYNELDIYKISYDLSLEIHRISLTFPKFELYELGSQIRRASKSVTLNIVEGYGRNRYKNEFVRFLTYSIASNDQVKTCLDYAKDLKYIDENKYNELTERHSNLGGRIHNFTSYVETSWR